MRVTTRTYEKQIANAITEVIINEMLYNADLKDRIASSSFIHMPDWYIRVSSDMLHQDGAMKQRTG